MFELTKLIFMKMREQIISIFCAGTFLMNVANGIVITEFLADPNATADAGFEYFEVFNNSSSVINVGDLTISDDDLDSVSFTGSTLTIGVGEFFVFGENSADIDINWNAFGAFTLANGADEIVISDLSGEIARMQLLLE